MWAERGLGIPRGKLGAVNTEKGEQVPGCWNTDSKYVAPVGCGTLSSQVVEGAFLHGGSQASLTSHCEDEVRPLRPPGDHVLLTICRRGESVLSAFPSAGFKPAASHFQPVLLPSASHPSSSFPPFSKAKPPAIPDPVGPASGAF